MTISYGMPGHYLVGRVPCGNYVHQALLVCGVDGKYETRAMFEETPIFKSIHCMKLARELAYSGNNYTVLEPWDVFTDEDVVFHKKSYSTSLSSMVGLFVSTPTRDMQFGVIHDTNFNSLESGNDLGELIVKVLNGTL